MKKIYIEILEKNNKKNKSLINKYKKEIQNLENIIRKDEEFFNNYEKNRIKKDKEINKYKQEIKEFKEKLNDKNDTSEIKSNDDDDDMPYLETEEGATKRIADFNEKKRKGYVDLPILLSKLNINSSKELVSNVKQLVKNLYDNKQITKQVYNILNKAITYKMTRGDQIKILDDKIKANNVQYDLDRMNAEISAYYSGDLPKYEYLTKKDLGYKPDAVEKVKFE